MPLPSALAERLAKRGLISKERTSILKKKSDEVEEEIIAESYDEPSKVKKQPDFANKKSNCPNQSNPYHECTKYCFEKYGEKKFRPNTIMEKRRIRMLKIYPLPPNWIEVPDINTNRYYYWNIHTNDVCWMSPSCPKAKIEQPKKPQKKVEVTKSIQDKLDEFMQDIDSEAKQPQIAINRESSSSKQESSSSSKKSSSSSSSSSSSKKVKLNNSEPLDPMDPASYSDIPRGKWSAGLEGSDKNAADDSASGPLFQQRPYPSPGQVLKSNKN